MHWHGSDSDIIIYNSSSCHRSFIWRWKWNWRPIISCFFFSCLLLLFVKRCGDKRETNDIDFHWQQKEFIRFILNYHFKSSRLQQYWLVIVLIKWTKNRTVWDKQSRTEHELLHFLWCDPYHFEMLPGFRFYFYVPNHKKTKFLRLTKSSFSFDCYFFCFFFIFDFICVFVCL